MVKLGVNIDHVATVRQARRTDEPDPVWAAMEAELGGAEGITFHLREDRRHINDRDAELLRRTVAHKLNMEMSIAPDIVKIAARLKPHQCTLVPEKRVELTTEGGLDVKRLAKKIRPVVLKLKRAGIVTSAFIEPDFDQVTASAKVGFDAIELWTGGYAHAKNAAETEKALETLADALDVGLDAGLEVHAGHGLTYRNVEPVAELCGFSEFNIGHSIVSRAVLVGMREAVAEMKRLLARASAGAAILVPATDFEEQAPHSTAHRTMNVLIAPDSFKDAIDARDAADAMAVGARAALADAEIVCRPLGDGGEGTGRILAQASAAEERNALVCDPLGRPVHARWWCTPDAEAIVEMAEASGITRLHPIERSATRTTSHGTGQLIRAAIDSGCERVLLCVGGSATVDGGAGCIQALGWDLLDETGQVIREPLSGAQLHRARAIRPRRPLDVPIRVLVDVRNPLVGPQGAARIFAPQKGADEHDITALAAALEHWSSLLHAFSTSDPRDVVGGGAAGGLPAALWALASAILDEGFAEVAERTNLDRRVAEADLVLTGEGCIDSTSAAGKVVAGVAARAARAQRRVIAFSGTVNPGEHADAAHLARALGLDAIHVISSEDDPRDASLAKTRLNLERAVFAALSNREDLPR